MLSRQAWIGAFAVGLLLIALPAQGWAQPTAEQLYQQGVAAFAAERYQESLQIFQRLHKEQPNLALVNFYLGATLQELQRGPEAIPYLTEALTLDPKLAQSHYYLGVAHYQAQEYEEALSDFREAKKNYPDTAVLYYYEGLVLLQLGRAQEALDPLLKCQELEKAFTTRATFLRGVAHYQLGQVEEARKAFKEVQTLEPESTLADDAAKNLQSLEAAVAPPKRFSFIVSGGFQYDDNVVLEPNGFSFISGFPTGPPVNLRIDDGRATASFYGSYRHPITERLEAGLSYSTYGAFHANFSNLNLNSHAPSAYLGYQYAPFYLRLEYDYNFAFLGSRSSVGFHTVGPNLFLTLHPRLVTQIQGKFTDKTFFGNQTRYSDAYVIGGNQFFYIIPGGGYLRLGYQYEDEDARAQEFDSEANSFSGGLYVPLPWDLAVSGEGSFQRRSYDHDYFGLGVRDEDQVTVNVTVTKKLFDNVSGALTYTRLANDANIGDFDYDQNIYGFNLTYEY